MNADLYTVLLFLGCVGLFLAIVVGRMQFSQDDELHSEVANRLKAVKSLEEDYQAQSDVAEKLGANLDRSDFLPMISRLSVGGEPALTTGKLFRRALALYEAIEHVDDEQHAERTYEKTIEEFGLADTASELHRSDLRTMLRVARVSIHLRARGANVEAYRLEISALAKDGKLDLSDGGRLRMREVLSLLQTSDMQALVDEYRDFIPVVEDLLLSGETVSVNRSS